MSSGIISSGLSFRPLRLVVMVNAPPILETIATETWVEITWDDFLTFADDPLLVQGRFYYDDGYMRLEMAPLGSAHAQDNTVLATLVNLFAALKQIPIKGLTNGSFRKRSIREAQPDRAFYIATTNDQTLVFPPHHNSPIDLDEFDPPTLVIEIAATSLEDDLDRKLTLYQRLGVREYWVVDVKASRVLAFVLSAKHPVPVLRSQVLPGLEMEIVEEALQRSLSEDDGALSRWLITTFSQT